MSLRHRSFENRLAGLADRIADRSRLGEAVSTALGSIAIQTAFLAITDIVYRRANLEHAAASVANVLQICVLILSERQKRSKMCVCEAGIVFAT